MQTIGVITNDQHAVFQRHVIEGIRETAEKKKYRLVVDSFAENPASPRPISLVPDQLDGLIEIANAAPESFLETAHRAGVPISLISHWLPHLPIPAVISNNAQGISELVRHLVTRCQRRKIVFIRGISEQIDAYEREEAFRRDLLRHNLDVPDSYFLEGAFSPDTAALVLKEFLKTGAAFDAVLAADYLMAIAAKEMLEAHHVRIPEQVSVVGFGDAPEAEKYGLTTVAANVRELGRRAAYQLISQMNGLAIRGVTTLSVELVIRKSCGCSK